MVRGTLELAPDEFEHLTDIPQMDCRCGKVCAKFPESQALSREHAAQWHDRRRLRPPQYVYGQSDSRISVFCPYGRTRKNHDPKPKVHEIVGAVALIRSTLRFAFLWLKSPIQGVEGLRRFRRLSTSRLLTPHDGP